MDYVQQQALVGHCSHPIKHVHADLQKTKLAAISVFAGTKALTGECAWAVIEVQDVVHQTRLDTNAVLKHVANDVCFNLVVISDCAQAMLSVCNEVQQVHSKAKVTLHQAQEDTNVALLHVAKDTNNIQDALAFNC